MALGVDTVTTPTIAVTTTSAGRRSPGYFPATIMLAAAPRWPRRKRSPPSLLDLAIRALPYPRKLITVLPDLAPRLCLTICSCCGRRDESVREYLFFSPVPCDVRMEDDVLGGYEPVDTSISNIEKLCAKCCGTW